MVSINGTLYQSQPITIDVTQCTVFGLQLLPLYIDKAFPAMRHGARFLFADDIQLVHSFEPFSLSQTRADIAGDLSLLEDNERYSSLQLKAPISVTSPE